MALYHWGSGIATEAYAGEVPVYVLLALGAALCFSLNAVSSKIAATHAVRDRNTLVYLSFLLQLVFVPFLLLLSPLQDPRPVAGLLVAFALTFYVGNFCILTALYRYDVSVFHPFFHFQTIFSVGLAYLLLGERFPAQTYLWIAGIIVGGLLVGMDERFRPHALFSRAFLVFLAGIFAYALSDIIAKKTLAVLDVWNLRLWSALLIFGIAAVHLRLRGVVQPVVRAQRRPVVVAVFFGFVASLFLFQAFSYNITVSQPLAMFGSLFTLLISFGLSRFRPGFLEHVSRRTYAVRAVGVLLMLSSAILLSLPAR